MSKSTDLAEGADFEPFDLAEYDELMDELGVSRQKRRRTIQSRSKRKLSPQVSKLMGDANMAFVCRDFEKVIECCREVIRCQPDISDPYFTLALVYDEMNDDVMYLRFSLIAAHLSPCDASLWQRLACLSREQGLREQAVYCYTKALSVKPDDVDLLWDRSYVLSEMNDYSKALQGLVQLSKLRPNDLQVAREIAQLYYRTGAIEKGIHSMEQVLSCTRMEVITYQDLNILCDLYMIQKRYEGTLQLLKKKLAQEGIENIPADLTFDAVPADILSKIGICSLHLGLQSQAEFCFQLLFTQPCERYGDLYLDIAEAYISIECFNKADPILRALSSSENYNMPAIWLKQAECCVALNRLEDAASYYEKVLQVVPSSSESRLALSRIYRSLGETKKALDIIEEGAPERDSSLVASEDPLMLLQTSRTGVGSTSASASGGGSGAISRRKALTDHRNAMQQSCNLQMKTFLHKCRLYLSMNDVSSFYKTAEKLIRIFLAIKLQRKLNHFEAQSGSRLGGLKNAENITYREISSIGINSWISVGEIQFLVCDKTIENTSILDWQYLFHNLCKVWRLLNNFHHLFEFICICLSASIFDGDFVQIEKLIFIESAIQLGYYQPAFHISKALCFQRPNSLFLWNLFNHTCKYLPAKDFQSSERFLKRFVITRNVDDWFVNILVGNSYIESGSYKIALSHYFKALQTVPSHPLLNLCISVVYLHIIFQRTCRNKHFNLLECFSFLFRYASQSTVENPQEVNYNVARAFHQLGMFHYASLYYHKVLLSKSALELSLGAVKYRQYLSVADNSDFTSLRFDAAYNLSKIYLSSGNRDLARWILFQHSDSF